MGRGSQDGGRWDDFLVNFGDTCCSIIRMLLFWGHGLLLCFTGFVDEVKANLVFIEASQKLVCCKGPNNYQNSGSIFRVCLQYHIPELDSGLVMELEPRSHAIDCFSALIL